MLALHVTTIFGWHQRGEPSPGAYLTSADGRNWKEARWPLPSGPQYEPYRGIYLGDHMLAYVQERTLPTHPVTGLDQESAT